MIDRNKGATLGQLKSVFDKVDGDIKKYTGL